MAGQGKGIVLRKKEKIKPGGGVERCLKYASSREITSLGGKKKGAPKKRERTRATRHKGRKTK